jgi:hypothetical protein
MVTVLFNVMNVNNTFIYIVHTYTRWAQRKSAQALLVLGLFNNAFLTAEVIWYQMQVL